MGFICKDGYFWPSYTNLQVIANRRRPRVLPRIFYAPIGRVIQILRGEE